MYFKYGFHVLTLWIHQASQRSGFKCPSGCSANTYSHHVFTGHWLGFKLTTARIIHWKPVSYYSKFFITFVRTESRWQILLRFQRKNSCQHSRYRYIFCSTWFLKRLKPITEKKIDAEFMPFYEINAKYSLIWPAGQEWFETVASTFTHTKEHEFHSVLQRTSWVNNYNFGTRAQGFHVCMCEMKREALCTSYWTTVPDTQTLLWLPSKRRHFSTSCYSHDC